MIDLSSRLASGDTLYGTFLGLGSALAAEACALAGFDWLLVDLEHGGGAESELLHQQLAADAHGVPMLVRVESTHRIRTGHALDLGAAGIMFPGIESAEQATQAMARTQPCAVASVLACAERGALERPQPARIAPAPRSHRLAGLDRGDHRRELRDSDGWASRISGTGRRGAGRRRRLSPVLRSRDAGFDTRIRHAAVAEATSIPPHLLFCAGRPRPPSRQVSSANDERNGRP
jgi:hypothetical protein